ncbi:MAG: hypothetical protein M8353_06005 [ANME-2 cluster archaeon]|nr:hypothetical protein [ANME-2 cluster archaeon]
MESVRKHSKEIFYGGTVCIVLLFIVLGYIFPANDSGIAAHNTLSMDSDQGMYTNWFT